MDANNTRYRSLVTAQDWTASVVPTTGSVEWNDTLLGVTLEPKLFEFRPGVNTQLPEDEAGRMAAFDSYGNLYALSPDRRSLSVRSTATGNVSTFWPVGDASSAGVGAIEGLTRGRSAASTPKPGEFAPVESVTAPKDFTLDALCVTRRHYLVVASRQAGGLFVFDLHGAGPPLFQPWPAMATWPVDQRVDALVPLSDDGLAVLTGNGIQRFGAHFKPWVAANRAPPTFVPENQNGSGSSAPLQSEPPNPNPKPCFIELGGALPAGVVASALGVYDEQLFVLSRVAGEPAVVGLCVFGLNGKPQRLRGENSEGQAQTWLELNALLADGTQGQTSPQLAACTLALTVLDDPPAGYSLFVVAREGDQAFRFTLNLRQDVWSVELQREFWPLRRYQALGFAVLPAGVRLAAYPLARLLYAHQGQWAPLLRLPRPRFVTESVLLTPVWDGGADGCEWHRVLLDMSLPSGTRVGIETRTSDGADATGLEAKPFLPEPDLIRCTRGSEQPWNDAEQGDVTQGFATWETLLQAAKGRWFQARLTLRGDGQRSPVLRCLRVWYPRFSYARNYLPPVFREDPSSADFLERFLALFEADFTRWEDRIAAAQLLLDARTAPSATLEWLSGWVGLGFDAADTDPERRRALIRYAVVNYARRGSVLGMLSAATLAWERTIDEAWLEQPQTLLCRRDGVRLQEFFSQVGSLPPSAWTAAQGRDALLARLVNTSRTESGHDPQSLVVGNDAARAALLNKVFGFVPRAAQEEAASWSSWRATTSHDYALPSDEPRDEVERADFDVYLKRTAPCVALRRRWQDFLARRYRRISALNADWGTAWLGFDRIPSPIVVPQVNAALAIWHRFEAVVLRAAVHAHRFRVVLPLPRDTFDLDDLVRRRSSVLRVIEREKPAHTVAEVRFGFELFRVGDARLGHDTLLEAGLSRRPELAALSRAVLGRTELGIARLTPMRPLAPADRVGLNRGESLDR